MLAIESPCPQFFDTDGSPLDGGKLYFGAVNQNPETSPITIYWDSALTQPAAQPIRTLNGYSVRSGSPAVAYAANDYSMAVRNKRGQLVIYVPSVATISNSQFLQAQITAIQADLASSSDAAKGPALVGYSPSLPYPAGTIGAHSRAHVSVLDYFTQAELTDWYSGSPTLDHTAAFNRATLATTAFTGNADAPKRDIFVPGGAYNIFGTVYVRKGQCIRGAVGGTRITGNAAGTGPTFKMGWGLISGVPTQDPGGLPPTVTDIHIDTGPAAYAMIDAGGTPGYFIQRVFLTNCGTGLNLDGSDGVISDIEIDQYLSGIMLSGQNILIDTPLLYLGNFGITVQSNARDSTVSGLQAEYTQYASVLLADGASGIDNVRFDGGGCLLNAQHTTFQGFIVNRAIGAKVEFSDMTFRNMKGYAYAHTNQTGSDITFRGCTFDGLKTSPGYSQSTTSGGVSTLNETCRLIDCVFRNLNQYGVDFGGSVTSELQIHGGTWSGISGTSFVNISNNQSASKFSASGMLGDGVTALINAQGTVPVRLKSNINWLGAQVSGSGRVGVKVPYQYANQWMVCVRANPNPAGSTNYRHTTSIMVQKQNTLNGATAQEALTQSTLLAAPANSLSALAVQLDIGAIGAGTPLTGNTSSGYAFMTVPNTLGSVEFEVEPLL